jgi:hypothetical protein
VMPFLRAGFNPKNHDTGIRAATAPAGSRRGYEPAELRRFACGDYFWYGEGFIAWGECCVFKWFLVRHLGRVEKPACAIDTRELETHW